MRQMAAPSTTSRQAAIGAAVRGFLTYSPSKINPQVSILFLRHLSVIRSCRGPCNNRHRDVC